MAFFFCVESETSSEVEEAIRGMKTRKAAGLYQVHAEEMEAGGDQLIKAFSVRFN